MASYVDARINTTHRYDEEKASQAVDVVIPRFIEDAIDLYTVLTGESWH